MPQSGIFCTLLKQKRWLGGLTTALLCVSVLIWAEAESQASHLQQELRSILETHNITPLDVGMQPSPAMVTLGRALMFDKILSGNRDISCATCHHPIAHTGDGQSVSIGTGGEGSGSMRSLGPGRSLIPRNAPEIFNRGAPTWQSMFWDSRVSGNDTTGFKTPAGDMLSSGLHSVLAAQAMFPVTSRDEMRGARGDLDVVGVSNELAEIDDHDLPAIWAAIMARLLAIPEYVFLFSAAYPTIEIDDLGLEHAANAIAAFEIQFWTFVGSPWDRFVAGADTVLSNEAMHGALLFYGEAGCATCHAGNLLTDQDHHNIGVPQIGPGKNPEAPLDFGRSRETGNPAARYAFRTPPLRGVALTGPWIHNGAYTTLEEAVRHHLDPASALLTYDPSGLAPALQDTFQGDITTISDVLSTLDPLVASPALLSDQDVDQLLAFLHALTDPGALDLTRHIPATSPSGLPVHD